MARVNYQRDKRQKDLARQRKQEEKRQKKIQKDPDTDATTEATEGTVSEEATAETEPAPTEEP